MKYLLTIEVDTNKTEQAVIAKAKKLCSNWTASNSDDSFIADLVSVVNLNNKLMRPLLFEVRYCCTADDPEKFQKFQDDLDRIIRNTGKPARIVKVKPLSDSTYAYIIQMDCLGDEGKDFVMDLNNTFSHIEESQSYTVAYHGIAQAKHKKGAVYVE